MIRHINGQKPTLMVHEGQTAYKYNSLDECVAALQREEEAARLRKGQALTLDKTTSQSSAESANVPMTSIQLPPKIAALVSNMHVMKLPWLLKEAR